MNATHITIGSKLIPFTSIEEASAAYVKFIDARGWGSSQAPMCRIWNAASEQVGYVSYNGKVWAGSQEDWHPDAAPIFNPYGRDPAPRQIEK